MSIQDKIAGNLLRKNADVLRNSGWDLDLSLSREAESVEYERMQITFKNADARVDIECEIADEPDLQIVGLQKHAGLGPYEGMIFLYDQPQKATFHMASVRFPIDIVFIGSDSRVTKIVENIEPGTPGRWGMSHTSAVVEVNGGFCRTFGIEVGTEVSNKYTPAFKNHKTGEIIVTPGHHDIEILSDRIASDNDIEDWEDGFIDVDGNFYDHHGNIKMSQLVPDDFDWVNGVDEIFDENGATGKYEINVNGDTWRPATDEENARIREEIRQHAQQNPSLFNRHQQKLAQEHFTRSPRVDINPRLQPPNVTNDRFKDHGLPDEYFEDQPMDTNFKDTEGYDVVTYDQDDSVTPTRPS